MRRAQSLGIPPLDRAVVEENRAELARAGHWGVAAFGFEGEPSFGEDRIDTLRWWLGMHRFQRS